jgi:hypothetical protein
MHNAICILHQDMQIEEVILDARAKMNENMDTDG